MIKKIKSKEDRSRAGKEAALGRIARQIERCQLCRHDKVGLAVPGEGDPDAKVVFIGEAPGKLEATTGRPFIGRSGQVLRKLISAVGLEETGVFITSPVKYLPVYVTPKLTDIEHGRTHLFKQLEIIAPEIVVLLGSVAGQAVLGEKFLIARDHGRVIKKGGINYLITYHPAAPLYNPKVRVELEKDFKKLKKLLV